MDVATLIDKYIKIRDKKAAQKKIYEADLARYTNTMAQIEAALLDAMNQGNLKAMSAPTGTAYKSLRTSAKVTDWPAALAFIREHEAWDLLEARVSKIAAQAIIEETNLPIPGVETSSEVCCNVQRAAASADK
jgi:hypothetical protein